MTRRHLLSVPGGRAIEFDSESNDAPSCSACGVTANDDGDVVHDADCPAARAIVARASQDISTDGAADFADVARRQLAREYADERIADNEPGAARAELAEAFLAGHRTAEEAMLGIIRVRMARVRDDLNTGIARMRAQLRDQLDQIDAELAALSGREPRVTGDDGRS